MAPEIPGMAMPLPPTDPGQGAHGSQPWYSRADDAAFAKVALGGAVAADAAGWTNAARNLRHYLGNSGKDLTISPDEMMTDDPIMKRRVDSFVTLTVQHIAFDPANHGRTVTFQQPWTEDHTFDQDTQGDWYFAVNAVHFTASGVVTVRATETDGGQPSVVVDYKCYVFDRYNWDSSGPSPKGVELLGFDISDKRMGGLHTAGYAQEFNMFGTSSVQHYEGVVPTNGAIDFPDLPDSRKGDRTDPTR